MPTASLIVTSNSPVADMCVYRKLRHGRLLIKELNEGAVAEADEIPEIDCSLPAVSRLA